MFVLAWACAGLLARKEEGLGGGVGRKEKEMESRDRLKVSQEKLAYPHLSSAIFYNKTCDTLS